MIHSGTPQRKEPKHAQTPLDLRPEPLAGAAPDLVGAGSPGTDPGRPVRGDAEPGTDHPVHLDRVVRPGLAGVLRGPGDDDLDLGPGLYSLVGLALSPRALPGRDRPAVSGSPRALPSGTLE